MSCRKTNNSCPRPHEEMIDLSAVTMLGAQGAALVSHLLAVARTGIVDMLTFRDSNLQALALEIQQLWIAAQAAKLAETAEVGIDKTRNLVTVQFGPERCYSLHLPVSGALAKKELAASLRLLVETLDPPVTDNQIPLPFEE